MQECLHSRDGRSVKEVAGLKIHGEPCVWCGGAACRSGSSSLCEPFDFLMHGEGQAFGLFHAKLTYRVASCVPGEEAYGTQTSTTSTTATATTTTSSSSTATSTSSTATATATSTSFAASAAPAVPLHVGEDCWGRCNRSSGLCEWCGEGNACCRKDWPTRPPACEGVTSFRTSFHECVVPAASSLAGQQALAPPEGAAGPAPATSAPPPPAAPAAGGVVDGGVGPAPAPPAPSPPATAEGQAPEEGEAAAGGQQAPASTAGAGPTPAATATPPPPVAVERGTDGAEEVVVEGSDTNSSDSRLHVYIEKATENGGGGIPGLALVLVVFGLLGVVGLLGCYWKHGWHCCHLSRHHDKGRSMTRSISCGGLSCDSAESDEQTSDEETVNWRHRRKMTSPSSSMRLNGPCGLDADSVTSGSTLPRLYSTASTARASAPPGRQASVAAAAAAEPQLAFQRPALAAQGRQFSVAAPAAAAQQRQAALRELTPAMEGNPPLLGMPAVAQLAPSPVLPAGDAPRAFELRTLAQEGPRVEQLEPSLPPGTPLITLDGARSQRLASATSAPFLP